MSDVYHERSRSNSGSKSKAKTYQLSQSPADGLAKLVSEVSHAWSVYLNRQETSHDSSSPKSAFVPSLLEFSPRFGQMDAYKAYLGALFDMALAMDQITSSDRQSLDKHGFAYAYLLTFEYYGDKPTDVLQLVAKNAPSDELAKVRSELDSDWASDKLMKDSEGRVTLDSFKTYLQQKHDTDGDLTDSNRDAFDKFLDKVFKASVSMMLPAVKSSLGGHCFRYGALVAGEFDFAGNGHSKDVLGLVSRNSESGATDSGCGVPIMACFFVALMSA